MTKKNILSLVAKDIEMMNVLLTVSNLNLPDWWIGAGFIRSKIWDYLHEYSSKTEIPDIDVIYYDKTDFNITETKLSSTKAEITYQNKLKELMPNHIWSVTNQARMHHFHNKSKPYQNSIDALSDWVETATCVGITLKNNKLILEAPRGLYDLTHLILKPTRNYKNTNEMSKRIKKKKWLIKWPKLKITRT